VQGARHVAVALQFADIADIDQQHVGIVLELDRVLGADGLDLFFGLGAEFLDAFFQLESHRLSSGNGTAVLCDAGISGSDAINHCGRVLFKIDRVSEKIRASPGSYYHCSWSGRDSRHSPGRIYATTIASAVEGISEHAAAGGGAVSGEYCGVALGARVPLNGAARRERRSR